MAPDKPKRWMNKEVANESTGFGKEDLRQVQGDPPPRGGAGDLRKLKTQAAPGLAFPGLVKQAAQP
jgi:hypothetical protein